MSHVTGDVSDVGVLKVGIPGFGDGRRSRRLSRHVVMAMKPESSLS